MRAAMRPCSAGTISGAAISSILGILSVFLFICDFRQA
jgi:hypothetical protein